MTPITILIDVVIPQPIPPLEGFQITVYKNNIEWNIKKHSNESNPKTGRVRPIPFVTSRQVKTILAINHMT